MTRYLTLLLLTLLTFTAIQSFGQEDTSSIKSFIEKQQPEEEKFIAFLKKGKIDDCLKYFSTDVTKKYGTDSLKKELKHLSTLLSKYPAPKITYSLGQNFRGIGTFGHDSEGRYEKRSLYQLMDKDSVVYYFSLYYSDIEPVATIKYYDSENFQEPFLKNLKSTQPILAPPTKENYAQTATKSYGRVDVEITKEKKPKMIYTKVEIKSAFRGGDSSWIQSLEKTLNQSIQYKNGAKAGKYIVSVAFVVDKEGNISDVRCINDPVGFGMEEQVLRAIKKKATWFPSSQGVPVRSYRTSSSMHSRKP